MLKLTIGWKGVESISMTLLVSYQSLLLALCFRRFASERSSDKVGFESPSGHVMCSSTCLQALKSQEPMTQHPSLISQTATSLRLHSALSQIQQMKHLMLNVDAAEHIAPLSSCWTAGIALMMVELVIILLGRKGMARALDSEQFDEAVVERLEKHHLS